ncbi:MAG TPA: DegT/DnrJ/EryC1/StrS family aminotransferase [Methylomirabilota bacterium]|jgi:dTDP-4-amino-4,6-dideoxygalactose transaminase|nr:DegT/DnrJ/EryC1/StrS family aminotransferase [Methylomirabilota bacterium]
MIPQIDLKRQHDALKAELMAAAERVLGSCRFILGPEGAALESELARLCGVAHGMGVASGTDALVIALRAVGVRPGDEVITSAFSFVASATAVLMVGARPVFVDIDPATYNLDPALAEKAVTPRTRAIVPVHLYGQPAAMDAIAALGRAHGLAVVEDAAQAVGASYGDKPAGAWGDAACLSFYPTKNLGGCGDGGMILTPREDVAQQVRRLRDHGSARKYEHVELGYSSRLDELQAALLRVKLRRLEEWNQSRRRIASRYRELLRGAPLVLPEERAPARHVYHQFTVRTPKRDALAMALADSGIGTAVHYPIAIPDQPMFAVADPDRTFAHATRASAEVLSLPCFPELTDAEVELIARVIRDALGRLH